MTHGDTLHLHRVLNFMKQTGDFDLDYFEKNEIYKAKVAHGELVVRTEGVSPCVSVFSLKEYNNWNQDNV